MFGVIVVFLVNFGMVLNLLIMMCDRGMGKVMLLLYLVFWMFLVILVGVGFVFDSGVVGYCSYFVVFLVINFVLLVFDYKDVWVWW